MSNNIKDSFIRESVVIYRRNISTFRFVLSLKHIPKLNFSQLRKHRYSFNDIDKENAYVRKYLYYSSSLMMRRPRRKLRAIQRLLHYLFGNIVNWKMIEI